MTSRAVDAAKLIETELNSFSFPAEYTTQINRVYRLNFDIRSAAYDKIVISIVPNYDVEKIAARQYHTGDLAVDIGFHFKARVVDDTHIDPLLDIVADVKNHFLGKQLEAGLTVTEIANDPLFYQDGAMTRGVFLSVLTLTCKDLANRRT